MCPIEYTIPLDVMSGIVCVIRPISGAAVIFLICAGLIVPFKGSMVGLMFALPYISSRSVKPLFAARRTSTLWMPFLVGEMKGPSQCAPRDSEPSSASRQVPEGPRNGSACLQSTSSQNLR